MRGASKLLLAFAAAVLLAVGVAACGSSSSTTTAQGSTKTTATVPNGGAAQGGGKPEHPSQGSAPKSAAGSGGSSGGGSNSGEGSAGFRTKGGDNSIQGFGSEASTSDRGQAAAALDGYLQARANSDWAKACTYMAAATQSSLEQLAGSSKQLKGKGCGPVLAALSAGIPAAARAEAAQANGSVLRVEGSRAFLLYHGAHGTDYFMPMVQEGGSWKVGSLAPSALS